MTDQETALTLREREDMLHALGLTPTGGGTRKRWAYRNRFVTTLNGPDYNRWLILTECGFAGSRESKADGLTTSIFFHVTNKGLDALGPEIKRRVPKEWRFEK